MKLRDNVERFLSHAEIITFTVGDKEAIVSFYFGKTQFDVYKIELSHKQLYTYFTGSKIKLVIYTSKQGKTTISFVDTQSADAVNIEGPKFVTNNLLDFLEKIPQGNRKMPFIISGLSSDGSTMVIPGWLSKQKPMVIHGYSITDDRPPE